MILEDARIGTRCEIYDSIVDFGASIPDGTVVRSTIVSNAVDDVH